MILSVVELIVKSKIDVTQYDSPKLNTCFKIPNKTFDALISVHIVYNSPSNWRIFGILVQLQIRNVMFYNLIQFFKGGIIIGSKPNSASITFFGLFFLIKSSISSPDVLQWPALLA